MGSTDDFATKEELVEHILEREKLLKQAKAEHYKTHFWDFSKEILGWPDINDSLHKDLATWVTDNRGKRRLILIPRGHLKSSLITVGYALWKIAQDPNVRILISNATYSMATNFLYQIKNVLQRNDKFKELFGDLAQDADSWRENQIIVSKQGWRAKEPTITVYGVGGSLTGQHYDVILLDDVVNRDTITTKEQIDKTKNFYKDCLDVLEPGGELIAIGTRWHQSDLYGWILDPDNGIINSFATYIKTAYEGEWEEGRIIFPEKFTWKHLSQLKREEGPTHFSAQYMNDPVPEESATFKKYMFQYYDPDDLRGLKVNNFVTVDPAISESKESDYNALVVISVTEDNRWYIREIVREKFTPSQLMDEIFFLYEKYRPLEIGIELIAFQKTLQYILEDEMRKRNRYLPRKELKPDNNEPKELRIKGLEPRYAAGTVYHLKEDGRNNIDYLEDELLRFPKGKHDDIIDALAYQNQIAFPPARRVTKPVEVPYSKGIFN